MTILNDLNNYLLKCELLVSGRSLYNELPSPNNYMKIIPKYLNTQVLYLCKEKQLDSVF